MENIAGRTARFFARHGFETAETLGLDARLLEWSKNIRAPSIVGDFAAFAVKSESGRDPARPVAICADGSTYYKTRTVSFPDIVRMELDRLLTSTRGIHYEILPQIDDAPMVGAAIVALQTA